MADVVKTAAIEFTANEAEFLASLKKFQAENKNLGSSFRTLAKDANAVFGGQLEQKAKLSADAIRQIGGATKLTDAEVKKHLSTLDAWIAKAQKLGQTVSPDILKARDSLAKINTESQKTPGLFDTISNKSIAMGAAIGSFVGNIAWSAVNKLGTELQEFVAQGAKLPAVSTSFERLAASADQNSQKMLAAMQKGTKGLVSDFDLMQTANKAFLLGLPVTEESIGDLSEAATKLGRAMGKDAKSSIDDLITALGRSSPMILDNLGLTVKVGEANEAYAAKLGKTADQLTEAEKKMAFYVAAMEAARKKTAELGDQTMTLGEIAESAWTKVGNAVTEAAATIDTQIPKILSNKDDLITFLKLMAVSGSPGAALEAMAAMDRARAAAEAKRRQLTPKQKAFDEAFNQKAALQALEREAKSLTEAVAPLTAKQLELATAFARGGKSASEIASKLNAVNATAGVTERQIQPIVDRFKDGKKAGDDYAAVLKRIRDAQIPLTTAQKTEIDQLSKLGISHSDIAKKLKVSEVAVKNYADEQKALSDIIRQQIQLLPRLKTEFQSLDLGMGMTPQIPLVPRSSLTSDLVATNNRILAGFLGDDTQIARAAIAAAKHAGVEAGEAMAVSWESTASDILKDSALGLGQGIINALGQGIATGDWSSFKDQLAETASSVISGGIAAALDYAVPGLGQMLQPFIKGLVDRFINLFRDEQAARTNDLRDAFLLQFGRAGLQQDSGFHNLARQLNALGRGDLFERIRRADTEEEFQAAVDDVTEALEGARNEMQRLAQEGGLASQRLLNFIDATRDSAESVAFLKSETRSAISAIGDFAKSSQFASQAGATAATDVVAAAVAQMRAEGLSMRQILKEVGPTIQEIQKNLAESGFSGSDAFAQIAADAEVAAGEITGPLLDGIAALTRGMEAASNARFLTPEMFQGLTEQILASRQALLDQGVAVDQVDRLTQHSLQTIWQLTKDYGFAVDDATQALLDQAEASGLVGDQFRSTFDRIAVAVERMADTIDRAFGRAGDSAEKAGARIDGAFRPRTVDIGFRMAEPPDVRGDLADTAATGGLVGRRGILPSPRYYRLGDVVRSIFQPRGSDTVPAMLTPGEGILNTRAMDLIGANALHALNAGRLPAPRSAASPDSAPRITYGDIHVTVQGNVDSDDRVKQIGQEVAKRLRRGDPDLLRQWQMAMPALSRT